jgi:tripartite-type tricarboxylate transporter receptor subunit TctC
VETGSEQAVGGHESLRLSAAFFRRPEKLTWNSFAGCALRPASAALRDGMTKFIAITFAILASLTGAVAQPYPSRPVTLIVPFPPGGLTDVVGRLIAEGMRTPLGQSVIIENVSGATGSIGTARVARAAPDGYTLVLGIWNTHVGNGAVYPLQYDVVNDFQPIAFLADAPLLFTAKKTMPANDMRELIAWLKANPDKASMGASAPAARARCSAY